RYQSLCPVIMESIRGSGRHRQAQLAPVAQGALLHWMYPQTPCPHCPHLLSRRQPALAALGTPTAPSMPLTLLLSAVQLVQLHRLAVSSMLGAVSRSSYYSGLIPKAPHV